MGNIEIMVFPTFRTLTKPKVLNQTESTLAKTLGNIEKPKTKRSHQDRPAETARRVPFPPRTGTFTKPKDSKHTESAVVKTLGKTTKTRKNQKITQRPPGQPTFRSLAKPKDSKQTESTVAKTFGTTEKTEKPKDHTKTSPHPHLGIHHDRKVGGWAGRSRWNLLVLRFF